MSAFNLNIKITISNAKKNLVLLHGWGFDSQVWEPIVDVLKENVQIYRVDLPGFGLSNYIDWEIFKNELITRLPDKFSLVGWSLGGLYATRLAIEAPDKVTHLFNVSSTPRFISDTNWPGVNEDLFLKFHHELCNNPERTLKNFMGLQLRGKSIESGIYPLALPKESSLQHGLEILKTWDLRNKLNTLKMPTCYAFGRLDAVVPYKVFHAMKQTFPQFEYLSFPKSAHAVFLSDQEHFLKELNSFINA